MKQVEIGKVYRHFKGNYYFVENVGFSSENQERLVIYKALYRPYESQIWVRPESMFLEEIDPSRKDNVTGQKCRFELAKDICQNYLEKE